MRSDKDLLIQIAAGDRQAFADFYDRHAARVFGLLIKLIGRRSEAEDVLQETFWHIWSRASCYDAKRSAPSVWLFMIARSRAKDHLRSRACAKQAVEATEDGLYGCGSTDDDVSSQFELAESAELTRSALSQLPHEQRHAISLAFYGGLTYAQIARRQSIPLGTVKTRIRLGMQRLRERLIGHQAVAE